MKKSSLRIVLAVALMMALPQISHAQSALLGTLKNAASAALANSSNSKNNIKITYFRSYFFFVVVNYCYYFFPSQEIIGIIFFIL